MHGQELERDVAWTALQWPGLEHVHLRLDQSGPGWHAAGIAVAVIDGQPTHVVYELATDPAGAVRRLELRGPVGTISLLADGHGHWTDRPELDGCVDVDIAITPLTNTLPIRRLNLAVGESAGIDVVYVTVPDLGVRRAGQRYTRTTSGYRYSSGSFTADLDVDGDGLVTAYSDLWKRS
ncbi:putative glycolipid-binding domain-containing protein [Xylanimonas sp. McL0601]|uniref:putative glycolipid-binding domain-containing protein n=1 Tax=Xylanimonas sp. McL0601 TaxID=3414739 RepID=UPI003CEF0AEB